MMGSAMVARRWLPSGAAALIALVSCSSPSHPTPLGDCVPGPDASCGALHTGAGGDAAASYSGGSSSGGVSAPPDDSGVCVPDDTVIISTSTPCRDCIVGGCCGPVTACYGDSSCVLLLSCAKACSPGGTFCVAQCERNYPAVAQASYESMAKCLETRCSTTCPVLTPGTNQE